MLFVDASEKNSFQLAVDPLTMKSEYSSNDVLNSEIPPLETKA